jgi:hypothetical protein
MKSILIVVSVAAISYFVWNHYFSHGARIERSYAACVSKLNAGMNEATAGINTKIPSGNDPSAALAKGMGDAMTSMVQGMTSAMGGASCGLIREACKQDFDGPLCQAALNSSR